MDVGVYIARVTANAMAAGRFVVLREWEEIVLSSAEAEDLLRVGYVELAEDVGPHGTAEAAALEPDETATAPAQGVKRRKAAGS